MNNPECYLLLGCISLHRCLRRLDDRKAMTKLSVTCSLGHVPHSEDIDMVLIDRGAGRGRQYHLRCPALQSCAVEEAAGEEVAYRRRCRSLHSDRLTFHPVLTVDDTPRLVEITLLRVEEPIAIAVEVSGLLNAMCVTLNLSIHLA
jgi:hypothetical protein